MVGLLGVLKAMGSMNCLIWYLEIWVLRRGGSIDIVDQKFGCGIDDVMDG